MDSLSLKSLPASHAKLMAQMETPTNTATAMLVCLDKMVTTWMQWASVGYGCFQWIGCLGKSLSQKAWNLSQIFPWNPLILICFHSSASAPSLGPSCEHHHSFNTWNLKKNSTLEAVTCYPLALSLVNFNYCPRFACENNLKTYEHSHHFPSFSNATSLSTPRGKHLAVQVQTIAGALGQHGSQDHAQGEPFEGVEHHHNHDASMPVPSGYIGKMEGKMDGQRKRMEKVRSSPHLLARPLGWSSTSYRRPWLMPWPPVRCRSLDAMVLGQKPCSEWGFHRKMWIETIRENCMLSPSKQVS